LASGVEIRSKRFRAARRSTATAKAMLLRLTRQLLRLNRSLWPSLSFVIYVMLK